MSENMKLLANAIEERTKAVVTVREADATNIIYTQLIAASDEIEGAFWAEVSEGDKRAIQRVITSGASVEMSFNKGYSSVFFDTTIVRSAKRMFKPRRLLMSHPDNLT